MQPYFFPYVGYFQLMAACDVFVILDDVQYIEKAGWANRNRILVNGKARWITVPVISAPHTNLFNQRRYKLGDQVTAKLLKSVLLAYRRAANFKKTYALIEEILSFPEPNVAVFNANLLRRISSLLGIDAKFVVSSEMKKDDALRGQERVIDICDRLGATSYRNPVGGRALYDPQRFLQKGITLEFLRSEARPYRQFAAPFVPSLSIIDVLMFNDEHAVRGMLREYSMLKPEVASV